VEKVQKKTLFILIIKQIVISSQIENINIMKKILAFTLFICTLLTLSAQESRYRKPNEFIPEIEIGIATGFNSLELVQSRPQSWGKFDCWRDENSFFSSQKIYIGYNISPTLTARFTFQKGLFTSYLNEKKLKNSMSHPHFDVVINLRNFWYKNNAEIKYVDKIDFKILFGIGSTIFKPYNLEANINNEDYNRENLLRFAYNGGGIISFPINKNWSANLEAQLILTTSAFPRSFHISSGGWVIIADITGGITYKFPIKKDNQ
jgi:hypothetical protein